MRRLLLVICFLLVAVRLSVAEDNTATTKARINKKRIFIGDRVKYTVEIPSHGKSEVEFPKFKENKIGDCEIKDFGKNWLDLTSYYVGKRTIPPIEIKYRKKGEKDWKTLKTNELSFTVESVLPLGVKLYDIKDIKGPIYPFSFLKLFMWGGLGVLVIWIIFQLTRIFRKKAPPKLPYEVALDELEAAKKQLSLTGDNKEYYVNISDSVRRYIERSFSLRAPEMTTQEFLSSLGVSAKLPDSFKGLLKEFMEACDLVKFARHTPSLAEIDSVFVTAKKFIEETKNLYPPLQSTVNK